MSKKITKKRYLQNLQEAVKLIGDLPIYRIDNEYKLLKLAFDIAYDFQLFDLYHFDATTQDEFKLKLFEEITPLSGNLAFLGIQILAANSIMNKNEFVRREKYFKKKCGIAINHLRAPKTVVEAREYKDGYLLNGTLSWASGFEIFDHLLIGFHYDNLEFKVISKFEKSKGFKIHDAPETFVGFGLNTVNITLKDYYVKAKNLVAAHPIGEYTKNKSLSKTVHYALYGIGCGALRHIENSELNDYLEKHLQKHKERFITSNDADELDQQRIELFNFLQKTITTGMIQNGGKSILHEKHLQQYYRELIMFNSNGLNDTIKALFLKECLKKS